MIKALDHKKIVKLKELSMPPLDIVNIMIAYSLLINKGESELEHKEYTWKLVRKTLECPESLIDNVLNFKANSVSEKRLARLERYVKLKNLQILNVQKYSEVAGLIYKWISAIYFYNTMDDQSDIYKMQMRKSP